MSCVNESSMGDLNMEGQWRSTSACSLSAQYLEHDRTNSDVACTMQGERPWSIQATAEEAAAKEFMALDGLGEAAAMALSLTKALGGQRHSSLASLTSWVAAEASRLTELQTFFLDRCQQRLTTGFILQWQLLAHNVACMQIGRCRCSAWSVLSSTFWKA